MFLRLNLKTVGDSVAGDFSKAYCKNMKGLAHMADGGKGVKRGHVETFNERNEKSTKSVMGN